MSSPQNGALMPVGLVQRRVAQPLTMHSADEDQAAARADDVPSDLRPRVAAGEPPLPGKAESSGRRDNMNVGQITSGMVMPSIFPGMCSSHCGTFWMCPVRRRRCR